MYELKIKRKFLFFTYWETHRVKSHKYTCSIPDGGYVVTIHPSMEIINDKDETVVISNITAKDLRFSREYTEHRIEQLRRHQEAQQAERFRQEYMAKWVDEKNDLSSQQQQYHEIFQKKTFATEHPAPLEMQPTYHQPEPVTQNDKLRDLQMSDYQKILLGAK